MKNLNKYVNVLENNNFSLKTKALASYLKGNRKVIDEFKDVIISFGLVSDADAEVWAVMITNYRLNGSSMNFGPTGRMGKSGWGLIHLFYDFDSRREWFRYYTTTVAPRTFNRWAKVLNELKEAEIYFAQEAKFAEVEAGNKLQITDLTLAEIEKMLGFKVRIIS
jgi:hypothetical protein